RPNRRSKAVARRLVAKPQIANALLCQLARSGAEDNVPDPLLHSELAGIHADEAEARKTRVSEQVRLVAHRRAFLEAKSGLERLLRRGPGRPHHDVVHGVE